MVPPVSVTVSVKVRRELVELADKMVGYGIARSRSHAFNIVIKTGVSKVVREVELWDSAYKKAEELKKAGYSVRHGRLNELLEEERRSR